jgi:hypothetical protein
MLPPANPTPSPIMMRMGRKPGMGGGPGAGTALGALVPDRNKLKS